MSKAFWKKLPTAPAQPARWSAEALADRAVFPWRQGYAKRQISIWINMAIDIWISTIIFTLSIMVRD